MLAAGALHHVGAGMGSLALPRNLDAMQQQQQQQQQVIAMTGAHSPDSGVVGSSGASAAVSPGKSSVDTSTTTLPHSSLPMSPDRPPLPPSLPSHTIIAASIRSSTRRSVAVQAQGLLSDAGEWLLGAGREAMQVVVSVQDRCDGFVVEMMVLGMMELAVVLVMMMLKVTKTTIMMMMVMMTTTMMIMIMIGDDHHHHHDHDHDEYDVLTGLGAHWNRSL